MERGLKIYIAIVLLVAVVVAVGVWLNVREAGGEYWRSDYIELMQHETEGTYGCFGCTSLDVEPPLCVDPIREMVKVSETEERYCDRDFGVVGDINS